MEKLNVVSKVLGVSKGRIKDMCKSGEITFEVVNGVYFVDENEIKQKLEENPSNIKSNESQFDDKFHSYLDETTKILLKFYYKTKNPYFMRKYELCKEVLKGDESPYTLSFLYDFVRFQFADVMRSIKKGNSSDFNLKLQTIYSHLKNELEKPNVEVGIYININPQNDYSY